MSLNPILHAMGESANFPTAAFLANCPWAAHMNWEDLPRKTKPGNGFDTFMTEIDNLLSPDADEFKEAFGNGVVLSRSVDVDDNREAHIKDDNAASDAGVARLHKQGVAKAGEGKHDEAEDIFGSVTRANAAQNNPKAKVILTTKKKK
mmetsp:Transcript_897/g.2632  ORF Transcript_897/g.2632 Transcript_897/m.2632 type:complete len:148 (-) Transcript_897:58-501(-)|eukprot:CAMPEP_0119272732 /NCGR_PEP_ID=MMETSP1329-20130426/8988_1 /TAXON_ID=114041 /ORGANISM="Genus nov. species nov., Strain RCC1024" /LENGTH=147 /DNA_ID=CAMNT_0007272829 /DNA_START=66 /DNA_END=509 /DNA_ORIENTATION=+